MDSTLRAYLEQAPPRPPPSDRRFTDGRLVWLLPLGAAATGGVVIVQVVPSHAWVYGALCWVALVLLALGAGRFASALRQRLLRTGTFASARVVSQHVENDGEELSLSVVFEVLAGPQAGEDPYRRNRRATTYRTTLSDRWLTEQHEAPFADGASFPILMGTDRAALIFIDDELVDAVRVSDG